MMAVIVTIVLDKRVNAGVSVEMREEERKGRFAVMPSCQSLALFISVQSHYSSVVHFIHLAFSFLPIITIFAFATAISYMWNDD